MGMRGKRGERGEEMCKCLKLQVIVFDNCLFLACKVVFLLSVSKQNYKKMPTIFISFTHS
jgi:hypothetical protein